MCIKEKVDKIPTYHKRILAFIGIGGIVISSFSFATTAIDQKIIKPYLNQTIKCQFDSLQSPYAEQLDDVTYDVKLVRNLLELTVDPEIIQAAVEKTNDTTRVWRVK